MERVERLKSEKISKLLISFSIPAIIGMLINALYNVVDRIFVGHGVGKEALSALTLCFPIMIVGMAFGLLVGIGSTTLISIRMGEKKGEEAEKIFGNAIILVIIISLLLTATGLIFINPILRILGANGQEFIFAKEYMTIIFIGMLPQTFTMAMNSIIRGEGNPKMAMLTMALGGVLNTILTPLFIFVFHLGVAGSAYATVISMSIGSIWVLRYFTSGKSHLKIKRENLALNKNIVKMIMIIGSSPFAVQIGSSVVTLVFNKQLLKYGTNTDVAVLGIAFSVMMVVIMPVLGISQGAQPIIGFNHGAKNYERVRKTLFTALIFSTIISFIGFTVAMIFPDKIISVFINSEEIVKKGEYVIRIFMIMLPLVGMQIIGANYFLYIGKPKQSIILTSTRQILLLMPLLLVLPIFFRLNGIWIAVPISDFLSFLITTFVLHREIKNIKRECEIKRVV
jgi:putative MATE family efflux protein